MFAKTLCKPGAYVEVVPVGLLATLEYNENGLLYRIYESFEREAVYTKDVFNKLKDIVPNTVPVTGGTTWIRGVFYTSNIPATEGQLPDCIYEDLYASEDLTFYAGHIESLGAAFRGPRIIRNWLNMAGFNVLPGAIVPVEFNQFSLDLMMSSGNYDFVYPFIAGYFIYEELEYRYVSEELLQVNVTEVHPYTSPEGYFRAEIVSASKTLHIDMSDVILDNIRVGSTLLIDGDSIIGIDSNSDATYDDVITCPCCGKPIKVTEHGPIHCSDINCLSMLYPNVQKFISALELPELSYEQFKQYVDDKQITCLTDVLSLPQYTYTERMQVSLEQVMDACVPADICSSRSLINKFITSCNHKVSTFVYYIKNPSKIYTELLSHDADSLMIQRLVEWLSDPYNSSTVLTLLGAVEVIEPKKSFEGAPIFRNRSIMLTGKFKRGTTEDVENILKSYSATVLKPGDPMICDCVIVGSLHESIDGSTIQEANLRGVTIVDEDDFFAAYDIDRDIASNLL